MDIYIGFKDADGNPSQALESQKMLMDSREKHVLAAGSLGWGKTDWLMIQAMVEAMSFKNNVVLLGRKTLGALKKSTLVSFFDLVDPKLIKRHDKQEQSITFLNNSKIFYMQLDESREAMQKVKSMNLGAVMVDQIEEITENVWIACIGQMRRKNASRRSFATANPNGHSWVWKRWINKGGRKDYKCVQGQIWREDTPPPKSQKEVTPLNCDNPYLPWDYIVDRLSQPERWVRRYVYGSWDNYEGLVWSEFDEQTHIIDSFEIPRWWNRYVVLDHGHRNPTAVLFFATDGDGDIYIYDCHYEANQWIDYHAEQIWLKVRQDHITRWLADPSIFHVRGGMSNDVSIAAQYEDYGIFFERADNDKQAGIDRVAQYIKVDPVLNKPRLFVFNKPALDPFIEEITDYRWEDFKVSLNSKEEPRKVGDHAMDCLRYAINHFEESGMRLPRNIPPEWLSNKNNKDSWKLV
tara:strand:- start:1695 stop:3086 length:1392 start_codon:yes stop_codon:yes gene_type:complete